MASLLGLINVQPALCSVNFCPEKRCSQKISWIERRVRTVRVWSRNI